MLVFELTRQDGEQARLRALDYLRIPSRYTTSISLYGRLSCAKWTQSSYLITNEDHPEQPRVIAVLDRARRPETELWFYGEWEATDINSAIAQQVLLDLFTTIKSLALPESINGVFTQQTDTEIDICGLDRHAYGGHASNSNIILCGAVHEKSLPLLRAIGILSPEFKQTEIPFLTYIFDNEHLRACKPLPDDLKWSDIRPEHIPTVQSRTLIPRQAGTLLSIPSVGIFSKDASQPIAWGFIGIDGSLTTLHVEAEYRGQGLAKTLTNRLLTEHMDAYFEGGAARVGHGHVAHENQASRRLCESVGGKATWSVHWLRVDLARI